MSNKTLKIGLTLGYSLLLAACGSGSTAANNNKLTIFVSATYHDGNLKRNAENGIAGGDEECMVDANRPDKSGATVYKAMLVDGKNRVAAPIELQKNWVLRKNTAYYSVDDTLIGTTNNEAVFTNLNSAFWQVGALAWTGLQANWNTGQNCNGWESNNPSINALFGISSSSQSIAWSSEGSIEYPSESCDSTIYIYCVAQ